VAQAAEFVRATAGVDLFRQRWSDLIDRVV
jgi:hypothetical protein